MMNMGPSAIRNLVRAKARYFSDCIEASRSVRRASCDAKSRGEGKEHGAACLDVKVPDTHYFRPERFPGFARLAQQHKLQTHEDFYKFSLEQNDAFWGTLAQDYLYWQRPFKTVQEGDFAQGKSKWFLGGQMNVSENCLDRHVFHNPDRLALIWERDEPGTQEYVTYGQLLDLTCRLANVLKDAGVRRGDRVCIYLPTSPMAVASMLACARIGAIHSVTFAGFSADSLRDRIQDSEAKVIITADESRRGGKVIPLKKIVDEAVQGCDSVKHVLVQQRGRESQLKGKDVPLDEALRQSDGSCRPEPLESEDPLFLLYTSGSTGKPKGVIHTQAGYLLFASMTHQVCFNYRQGEIFGCLADVGWVTGHSYIVYGPLSNGGTTVLYESTPMYPNASRYWETVERLGINHLFVAPTAIRLLLSHGDKHVEKHDTSSLKSLGCVGEPINHEAWEWYYEKGGNKKCPVVDTYWQTETGGVCLAPLPAGKGEPIYPSMAMRPMFGIEPVLKEDEALVDHGSDMSGALCFARSWPGITRGIWGDEKRFKETYFSVHKGFYFTGDAALQTTEGYYRISGRTDDVINISGHRLGTAEVEDAVTFHKSVAESAVVSIPHGIKGEGLVAFVTLVDGSKERETSSIAKELKDIVKMKIAGYAVPDEFVFVPGLPKTRSGKIMRRMLKLVTQGETSSFGDTSTLSVPDCMGPIVESWSKTKISAEVKRHSNKK